MKDAKALVIFSGGQDSTTCLYWALKNFSEVETLTFDYGQRHQIELESAAKIAKFASVPSKILALSSFDKMGSNSLTGKAEVSAELNPNTNLPNSFVPGRNLIFLTYAAAYAYSNGITNLIGGMCQTDYSGYPDCRQKTLDALMVAINLGMESEIKLHTPLMNLTKAESVKLAVEVSALEALKFSHTCYNGMYPPCGSCPACHLRAKGFEEAGIKDPLLEARR
jgi:7-cyano-7-deazaguanine synthase